jgi:diguanylate cyclase (GGDEF)-like protein
MTEGDGELTSEERRQISRSRRDELKKAGVTKLLRSGREGQETARQVGVSKIRDISNRVNDLVDDMDLTGDQETLDGLIAYIKSRENGTDSLSTKETSVALAASSKIHDIFQQKAERDGLTKLVNREKFLQIAAKEQKKAITTGKRLGILMLDVDKFKLFNDDFGHDVGDKALIKVAETLIDNVRLTDIVKVGSKEVIELTSGRYGGEEFVGLLLNFEKVSLSSDAEIADDQLARAADRLRQEIEKMPPLEGVDRRITASIGATYLSPQEPVADAMKRADGALYKAKEGEDGSGRNQTWVNIDGKNSKVNTIDFSQTSYG